MIHDFKPGDFLIFQLESGYGLLRVLAFDEKADETVWHVTVYRDLFLDPEMADSALEDPSRLSVEIPHIALTDRAFQSTQVAFMKNRELTSAENEIVNDWSNDPDREITDRSVRLLLGLR
jgi:hypothetical protein